MLILNNRQYFLAEPTMGDMRRLYEHMEYLELINRDKNSYASTELFIDRYNRHLYLIPRLYSNKFSKQELEYYINNGGITYGVGQGNKDLTEVDRMAEFVQWADLLVVKRIEELSELREQYIPLYPSTTNTEKPDKGEPVSAVDRIIAERKSVLNLYKGYVVEGQIMSMTELDKLTYADISDLTESNQESKEVLQVVHNPETAEMLKRVLNKK